MPYSIRSGLTPQATGAQSCVAATGILTSGSSYQPHLPARSRLKGFGEHWFVAAFVPGYSGGSVTASDRLP